MTWPCRRHRARCPRIGCGQPWRKGDGLHNASTARNVTIFLAASVVTLVAGVVLEQSGDRLADLMGINGVLFGATVLALASALPEISTAITGVKMKAYTLVFGDIFGSNAFQLILFVLADLLAGQPVPHEGRANAWIGTIGLVMTAVYVAGILLRKPRRYWGLRRGFVGGTADLHPGKLGLRAGVALGSPAPQRHLRRDHAGILRLLEQREAGQIGVRQCNARVAETGKLFAWTVPADARHRTAQGRASAVAAVAGEFEPGDQRCSPASLPSSRGRSGSAPPDAIISPSPACSMLRLTLSTASNSCSKACSNVWPRKPVRR
jgi:hypothetical protein